jgi:hypothetical protein
VERPWRGLRISNTGTRLTGLAASGTATVESVQWIGEQALKVIFRDGDGRLSERLLYRDDEPSLELVEMGRPWSFDGDGDLLRLVSEAYRINLAWLFDPYVAITTSIIEPLPLPRCPCAGEGRRMLGRGRRVQSRTRDRIARKNGGAARRSAGGVWSPTH